MSEIIDSYSESNGNANQIIDNTSPFYYTAKGQSFTGKPCELNSAVFYARKFGSPTGNAYVKIYAHSGTYGTSSIGTGLPLATSDPIDVSTLTTSYQLITWEFSGSNCITLDNTYYVAVVEYDGGNATDYIAIISDNSAPSHSGNLVFIGTSGWGHGFVDVCFYIYGTLPQTPIVGNTYPLPPFKRS